MGEPRRSQRTTRGREGPRRRHALFVSLRALRGGYVRSLSRPRSGCRPRMDAPRRGGYSCCKQKREDANMSGMVTDDLLQQINDAFNSRDVERIMGFFTDDCTFLMARGPERDGRRVHGKDAVRKTLADRFQTVSGMKWEHIERFVCGDRAVTVWTVTGKDDNGEVLNFRGCDLYEFHDGKILNKDTYWKQVTQ